MKRTIAVMVAALTSFILIPGVSASASTGTPWRELRHQFDYQRTAIQVTEVGRMSRAGVAVHDITYRAVGQQPVSAYLVTPTRGGRHPAALFLHWLDSAADSNRGEFLDEAVALAAGPQHVISLLPQLVFPFDFGPVGDVRDRRSITDQVVQLRRGLDLLDARHDVQRNRVAVVGHDYGAMYGMLVAAVDRDRVHADVVMAADSTWANWFVTFFLDLPADRVAPYTATLASLDPIQFIGHAPRHLLLQYATDDFFIPLSVAESMRDAARPTATLNTYPTDHALDVATATRDRDAFLAQVLR